VLSIKEQIERKLLLCPVTYQPLKIESGHIETIDGTRQYPFINSVPHLFKDAQIQQEYLQSDGGKMECEYRTVRPHRFRSFVRSLSVYDFRSEESKQAFLSTFSHLSANALCLSIGGGPTRPDPIFVNLNIGPFPNVDVVADAYALPYGDETVDAIFCEAVLEHLEFPDKAVAEMQRVLRIGKKLFAATPFLQSYHGYPNHFQNFTLTGHQKLFERAGFHVSASGACVGPTVALSQLLSVYGKSYFPRPLRRIAGGAIDLFSIAVKPFDRVLNKTSGAHILASTTYLCATKVEKQIP
jgi:SAM-dependent methyltransferase